MRKRRLQWDDRRNTGYFVRITRKGVSKYFPLGTNRRDAETKLLEVERDIRAGRIQFVEQETSQVVREDGARDLRVEELAVKHLEWIKTNRSDGTFLVRQYYLLQFLGFIGESMVSGITRVALEKFHAWARANHARCANGGNEALANVKAMLRWGEEMEMCGLSFRKFPKLSRTPPETKRLPEADLAKLLAAADDDLRDMLRFGLLTGLRPKELMELRRSSFLTDGNGDPYVSIQRHKTSRSARTPRPRSVPLCPDAHAIVQRLTQKHPDSEVVFLNGRGTPYTRYSFKTRLARLCKRAGTSRIFTPYSLRHTFASMESDAGVETTSLSRLMGHTTTRTLERYVSNTFAHHRQAVTALQDRIRLVAPLVDDCPPALPTASEDGGTVGVTGPEAKRSGGAGLGRGKVAGDKTETELGARLGAGTAERKRTCYREVASP